MAKTLKIRDLTLRDGQQSSFATRMTQQQIDRCLPYYKDANFYAMEVWGGAVPDSVMRYLNENPWTRLETIKKAVGDVSYLTALSRGRNLFGYSPYTDEIIAGFSRNAIESGLGIMRIFDALNDVDNVKSTIKYIKQYGGIADCAVCYTVDPKYTDGKEHEMVFTDEYFLDKAKQMAELGADMITIKDMSGLIPPQRVSALIKLFKQHIGIPVDFHTHCTPGYGLASVMAAIVAGVDIVDTNCWWFGGGTGAPALELVYVFCKKLGIDLGVDMEAVAKINGELKGIRKELEMSVFGAEKPLPKPFNPLTDTLPAEIDALFDKCIEYAQAENWEGLLDAAQQIEAYFGFPAPNKLVQQAEIPGGMYSNMVAQLKQLQAEDILPRAMELIPSVRLSAGLPPLVTPSTALWTKRPDARCTPTRARSSWVWSRASTDIRPLRSIRSSASRYAACAKRRPTIHRSTRSSPTPHWRMPAACVWPKTRKRSCCSNSSRWWRRPISAVSRRRLMPRR